MRRQGKEQLDQTRRRYVGTNSDSKGKAELQEMPERTIRNSDTSNSQKSKVLGHKDTSEAVR
jgi:hypothetical protein